MKNSNIKAIINILKSLNKIALLLINIANFYKNNSNNPEVAKLLDEVLKSQFKDTSLIILNTFKHMITLRNNDLSTQKINEDDIKDKLESFIIVGKNNEFETLAFIILEIIILINDSIYNESSKEIHLNFVKSFSKLYIFEKQNLEEKLLKNIIKEIFDLKI